MPRKPKLPKYTVMKAGNLYARRTFPTTQRDDKGRVVYVQVSRKVEPPTKERAAVVSDQIEAMYREVKAEKAKPQTVSKVISEFVDAKATAVSRRTADYYSWMASKYIKGKFAQLDAHTVTPRTVQDFYSSLALSCVSSKMMRKVHVFLSMAFKQAVRWETLVKNPCVGVVLPVAQETTIEIMTEDQARKFMEVCADPKYLVLAFALETGMRPGEYLALGWSEVDLENRTVRVERSVSFPVGGGYVYKSPKTNAGKRTIEISEHLAARLRKVRKKKDLVFPARNGEPRRINNLGRREMAEVCELVGIPKLSVYSLRHSMATLSLMARADIKTISQKMGHKSIQVTLDLYSHVLPVMKSDATARLANVLYI